MRHNAAILQSTLLALGLRDNVAALIRELKTGMAALQEVSTKVSFFSTQNPLLPDGYSNLPTYCVFTEERQSLLAKKANLETKLTTGALRRLLI